MKIYNSRTRKKEEFKPLKKGEVTLYVCGITPYDTTHLGHAFTYISFDAVVKYLIYKGYKVNYTQNVTDIDDDILRKAKEEKEDWRKLGNFWTEKFLEDLKFLNILIPNHYVKATNSIDEIIEINKDLFKKGMAYENGGNLYYDVSKFKSYGKLSKYSKRQMLILLKERGGDPNDPLKKNKLDFILWQKSKKGEPFWESPWGNGRPGWHIECSAMVRRFLGEQIDIHGGGKDLIFPHHESEIAQSESYTEKEPFVGKWMHTAMVMCSGEKMSKSLGNLVMVSKLSKKYPSNVIRWMLLSNHYRMPWEYDDSLMTIAKKEYSMIEKILEKKGNYSVNPKAVKKFEEFMEDDFQVQKVLRFVLRLSGKEENKETIKMILEILGFKVI